MYGVPVMPQTAQQRFHHRTIAQEAGPLVIHKIRCNACGMLVHTLQLELEQARYEVRLAARRYEAIDPVVLKARESFRTTPVRERLDTVLNVGLALGDDTLVTLAGLARNELSLEPAIAFEEVLRRAKESGLDLNLEVLIKRIRRLSWGFRSNAERTEVLLGCRNAIREGEFSKLGRRSASKRQGGGRVPNVCGTRSGTDAAH